MIHNKVTILQMSQLFESRFKTLIKSLNQCQYDFPEELHQHLHQCLIDAGYDQIPSSNISTPTTTSKSTTTSAKAGQSKLNGYHVFIKEKMPEVKADTTIPATGRMGKLGQLWKALTKEEQSEYKVKAEDMNKEQNGE
jgi:hypothetical protein